MGNLFIYATGLWCTSLPTAFVNFTTIFCKRIGRICLLIALLPWQGCNWLGPEFSTSGNVSSTIYWPKQLKTQIFWEAICYFSEFFQPSMAFQCCLSDSICSARCIHISTENFWMFTRFLLTVLGKKWVFKDFFYVNYSALSVRPYIAYRINGGMAEAVCTLMEHFHSSFDPEQIFLKILLPKIVKERFLQDFPTTVKSFYAFLQIINVNWVSLFSLRCPGTQLRAFEGTLGCRKVVCPS